MEGRNPGQISRWYNLDIEKLIIEDGVTRVGHRSFSHSKTLKEVVLGKDITSIGAHAFYNCTNLQKITLNSKTLPILGDEALFYTPFSSNTPSGDIIVPYGSKSAYDSDKDWNVYSEVIQEGFFGVCGEDLTWEFDADEKILTIRGEGDMYDYYDDSTAVSKTTPWAYLLKDHDDLRLETVTISDGVTSIGNMAFINCKDLQHLNLGKDVQSIGNQAFSGCSKIQSISFPKNITSLEKSAFYNCESLYEVTFEGDLKSIGNSAFRFCNNLNRISFNGRVDQIGMEAFANCNMLKQVVFEDAVGTIGAFAFSASSSLPAYLTDLTFKKGVQTIAAGAFTNNSSLKEVTLPDVKSIGASAFADCTALTKVVLGKTIPQIEDNVFYNTAFVTNAQKGIIVPDGSGDAYKTAWTEWKDHIKEENETDSSEDNNNSNNNNNGNNSNNNNNNNNSNNNNNNNPNPPEDTRPDDGRDDDRDDDRDDNPATSSGNRSDHTTSSASESSVPSYAVSGTWKQDEDGSWTFSDSSGKSFQTAWGYIRNPYVSGGQSSYDWFRFDENGKLLTGWFTDPADGNTYYLNPASDGRRGAMLTGWHWIDADGDGRTECYYFNEISDGTKGKLLCNTVTPDGYTVNEKGQWTVNGIVQTK